MLLVDVTVIKTCAKGRNLAEVHDVGKHRVETAMGPRFDPTWTGVYVGGLPFGDGPEPILAPVDLLPGDMVRVTAGAFQPWDVTRDGKAIWQADTLIELEKARADNVATQRAARKAQGAR